MKTLSVKATTRTDLSKIANKQLRRSQKVPAVLYGNGPAANIVIDYPDAKSILFTPDTYIVQLEIDGKVENAIIRETQYHPVTDKILHIDFLRVNEEKEVELVLPIRMVGTPKGVIKGGKVMPLLRRIKVKGIPVNLPSDVEIDISDLDLGMSIKVESVKAVDGMTITSSLSAAIASVEIPRALRGGDGVEGEEGEEGATEGEEGDAAE